MKRTLTIISASALLIAPLVHCEEPDSKWNPDVLSLFSLRDRDAAMQKLVAEGRYPEAPKYKEEEVGEVKEVVICPQSEGQPLVTVFARSKRDPEDMSPRSGHLIVIRNDGMILPFFNNANLLNGHLCDPNGDGIMDYIDSFGIRCEAGTVTGFHIVPITESFLPTLDVYWKIDTFDWRLFQPNPARLPKIQILKKKKDNNQEVVAEYTWSKIEKRWIGPDGSIGEGFLRLKGDLNDLIPRLNELVKAK